MEIHYAQFYTLYALILLALLQFGFVTSQSVSIHFVKSTVSSVVMLQTLYFCILCCVFDHVMH